MKIDRRELGGAGLRRDARLSVIASGALQTAILD
jgi:hypothetical protein